MVCARNVLPHPGSEYMRVMEFSQISGDKSSLGASIGGIGCAKSSSSQVAEEAGMSGEGISSASSVSPNWSSASSRSFSAENGSLLPELKSRKARRGWAFPNSLFSRTAIHKASWWASRLCCRIKYVTCRFLKGDRSTMPIESTPPYQLETICFPKFSSSSRRHASSCWSLFFLASIYSSISSHISEKTWCPSGTSPAHSSKLLSRLRYCSSISWRHCVIVFWGGRCWIR